MSRISSENKNIILAVVSIALLICMGKLAFSSDIPSSLVYNYSIENVTINLFVILLFVIYLLFVWLFYRNETKIPSLRVSIFVAIATVMIFFYGYLQVSSSSDTDLKQNYNFLLTLFISIWIAMYVFLDAKMEANRQNEVLEAVKDSTRNYVENFSDIFAKHLKILLDIKANKSVIDFKYTNFFLNFGEVYTMFPKHEKSFKESAKRIGLDSDEYNKLREKIKSDKFKYRRIKENYKILDDELDFENLDFTNLNQGVKIFQLLLMEIIDDKESTYDIILVGDSNVSLSKTTEYYNRSYEISTLIISIVIENTDYKLDYKRNVPNQIDIKKIIEEIRAKDYSPDLLLKIYSIVSKIFKDNIDFSDNNELEKIEDMKILFEIYEKFFFYESIEDSKKADIKKLNECLCNRELYEEKPRYWEEELKLLKGKVFSNLEAIYYLLANSKVHNKSEYAKQVAYYILYSEKINRLLISEYRRRKAILERIKNHDLELTTDRNIHFLNKTHFAYQGIMGNVKHDNDTTPSTMIFFIGGNTVGSVAKGYYSEQKDMFNLHKSSFENVIKNNIEKQSYTHVKIFQDKSFIENIYEDINKFKKSNLNPDLITIKAEDLNNELLLYVIKAALNFRFWINYDNEAEDKYWGQDRKGSDTLFKLLDEMVEKETDYLDYFTKLDKEGFCEKMKYEDIEIPGCEIRYGFIKTIVAKMNADVCGSPMQVLLNKSACNDNINKYDVKKIVHALIIDFKEVFTDEIKYKGDVITVAKKATYFIKLLYKTTNYRDCLYNLDSLNILADYRIPQYLRHKGIFKYSPDLIKIIDEYKCLEVDSIMEREIRLATVSYAKILVAASKCQYFKTEKVSILDIDEYIWRQSQTLKSEKKLLPFHRVVTSKY